MTVWLNIGGKQRRVSLPEGALEVSGPLRCSVDGQAFEVDARIIGPGLLSLLVEGRQFRCILDRELDNEAIIVTGQRHAFTVADPRSLAAGDGNAAGSSGPRSIKAPMPGRVVRVLVAVGDQIEEQQGLVVIEAMKMQNELKSPKQGRVARLSVEVGGTVAAGDVLVVVE